MPKTQTFTSTLPIDLSQKLDLYAQANKIPKNKIIEQALDLFFIEERKKKFLEGVKKIGNDPDQIEWSEWGITDYGDQLKQYPV